jgi:hypothetical protein
LHFDGVAVVAAQYLEGCGILEVLLRLPFVLGFDSEDGSQGDRDDGQGTSGGSLSRLVGDAYNQPGFGWSLI